MSYGAYQMKTIHNANGSIIKYIDNEEVFNTWHDDEVMDLLNNFNANIYSNLIMILTTDLEKMLNSKPNIDNEILEKFNKILLNALKEEENFISLDIH